MNFLIILKFNEHVYVGKLEAVVLLGYFTLHNYRSAPVFRSVRLPICYITHGTTH